MKNSDNLNFEFASANRIIFGCGTIEKFRTEELISHKNLTIFHGSNTNFVNQLTNLINANSTYVNTHSVHGEPTISSIQAACTSASGSDVIVAIGGGSVIDTGKAVAALLTNEGVITDYLEVVGRGMPIKNLPLPFIAIPTTSGTGSEVTKNAVIGIPERKVKVSLRHIDMLPAVAIIDPELTLSIPQNITAYSGMDALTQVIEPFVSIRANVFVDSLCRNAISKASIALKNAYDHGTDICARTEMAWVSLCGGIALANAGLGAVHGFAGPIGGMYEAPHGAICARLLPLVVEANISHCSQKSIATVLDKYREIAAIIKNDRNAKVEFLIDWLFSLVKYFKIPGLSYWGMVDSDIPAIIKNAQNSSSMKGNPIIHDENTLAEILYKSL